MPLLGNRLRDLRNDFTIPFRFTPRNVLDFAERCSAQEERVDRQRRRTEQPCWGQQAPTDNLQVRKARGRVVLVGGEEEGDEAEDPHGAVGGAPAALTEDVAIFAHDALEEQARFLAHRLAQNAPAALAVTKALIHRAHVTPIEQQLDAERDAIIDCMHTEEFRVAVKLELRESKPYGT